MKDLTFSCEDRPGQLAVGGEALGKAGINIEGSFSFTWEGRGFVHFLVEDATTARTALEGTGWKFEGEADAIVVEAEDRPGTLGRFCRAIADAGINIQWCYVGSRSRLVFCTADNDAARAALGV
jgi:hypothetical protein